MLESAVCLETRLSETNVGSCMTFYAQINASFKNKKEMVVCLDSGIARLILSTVSMDKRRRMIISANNAASALSLNLTGGK